ncbi:Flavin-dependent oxidoreductase, luciferase family (includes alkanesulfonate monooxygenase SsuD and methylene tetrahydromethanopterin reductase) [Sphingomonas laterariae]|uniref:Flavin-dependent oxidoreductase, luciferase family (Includes alkanesulfonate monooxygenase SsuD and methylene tetrahydromethanopterin reductase) n=1 Tax=Edaphosphingomonas laterariae TaxID=861865 RepID=A0A239F8B6_9SPHN|nr:LLM class flavin-dependent oxidoreductase [Sphingomonas laterariae]SNS52728.1 Flavin-dependent oxidoreductase, luciferase family (includes alkanesulfonate monooxygenase SsuD and methylene tetrahydromethanopterin reductase) [Sphingomonas laterariae]
MKIGLCMPYMVRDYDRDRMLTWARKIDAGPFDSLSCGERITGYSYEMHSILCAAAAVTERVRIMPSLYVLPMRSAVMTAKEVATLDAISGGRVGITVGVGGREKDYQAVGAPFTHRHQRLDEQVAEMKRVWRGETLFEGMDEIGPASPQGADIPIYAGAMGPKAIARASAWADGIYGASMLGDREGHQAIYDMARTAWAERGRTDKPYLIASFWCSLSPDAEQDLKAYIYDYMKYIGEDVGRGMAAMATCHTPDGIRQAIENVRAAGADELLICPATAHYDEIDRLADLIG